MIYFFLPSSYNHFCLYAPVSTKQDEGGKYSLVPILSSDLKERLFLLLIFRHETEILSSNPAHMPELMTLFTQVEMYLQVPESPIPDSSGQYLEGNILAGSINWASSLGGII